MATSIIKSFPNEIKNTAREILTWGTYGGTGELVDVITRNDIQLDAFTMIKAGVNGRYCFIAVPGSFATDEIVEYTLSNGNKIHITFKSKNTLSINSPTNLYVRSVVQYPMLLM